MQIGATSSPSQSTVLKSRRQRTVAPSAFSVPNVLMRAVTRFGKWCRKIIDPEPEPTENDLLEFLPGFRDLFAADIL